MTCILICGIRYWISDLGHGILTPNTLTPDTFHSQHSHSLNLTILLSQVHHGLRRAFMIYEYDGLHGSQPVNPSLMLFGEFLHESEPR